MCLEIAVKTASFDSWIEPSFLVCVLSVIIIRTSYIPITHNTTHLFGNYLIGKRVVLGFMTMEKTLMNIVGETYLVALGYALMQLDLVMR